MKQKTIKRDLISDVDKALQEFSHTHKRTPSELAEIVKAERVARLMGKPLKSDKN